MECHRLRIKSGEYKIPKEYYEELTIASMGERDPLKMNFIENEYTYYQQLILLYSQKVHQLRELEQLPDPS